MLSAIHRILVCSQEISRTKVIKVGTFVLRGSLVVLLNCFRVFNLSVY